MRKQLRPLENRPTYALKIEKKLIAFLKKNIYDRLTEILSKNAEMFNSKSYVVDAIRKGRIQYVTVGNNFDAYVGNFNANISKELRGYGAKFSKQHDAWLIPRKLLPVDVLQANIAALDKFEKINDDVRKVLDEIKIGDFADALDLNAEYERIITSVDTDFRSIAKSIGIVPELDEATKAYIADDYTNNMKLYIKGWNHDNIKKLRKEVDQNAKEGYRADTLAKLIQKNYNVSKSKAMFLAKQETSLLTSKLRQERFKSANVFKYRWATSNDNRVRDSHKQFNKKIYSWDDPPEVMDSNKKTRKVNPGEDFGCRCVAIPIYEE